MTMKRMLVRSSCPPTRTLKPRKRPRKAVKRRARKVPQLLKRKRRRSRRRPPLKARRKARRQLLLLKRRRRRSKKRLPPKARRVRRQPPQLQKKRRTSGSMTTRKTSEERHFKQCGRSQPDLASALIKPINHLVASCSSPSYQEGEFRKAICCI